VFDGRAPPKPAGRAWTVPWPGSTQTPWESLNCPLAGLHPDPLGELELSPGRAPPRPPERSWTVPWPGSTQTPWESLNCPLAGLHPDPLGELELSPGRAPPRPAGRAWTVPWNLAAATRVTGRGRKQWRESLKKRRRIRGFASGDLGVGTLLCRGNCNKLILNKMLSYRRETALQGAL